MWIDLVGAIDRQVQDPHFREGPQRDAVPPGKACGLLGGGYALDVKSILADALGQGDDKSLCGMAGAQTDSTIVRHQLQCSLDNGHELSPGRTAIAPHPLPPCPSPCLCHRPIRVRGEGTGWGKERRAEGAAPPRCSPVYLGLAPLHEISLPRLPRPKGYLGTCVAYSPDVEI